MSPQEEIFFPLQDDHFRPRWILLTKLLGLLFLGVLFAALVTLFGCAVDWIEVLFAGRGSGIDLMPEERDFFH